MLNTNIGDTQMGNLLLEDFINEINSKRENAIQKAFTESMAIIGKQITKITEYVDSHNERNNNKDKFVPSVAIENGFTTQEQYWKSAWYGQQELIERFSFSNVVFQKIDLDPKNYMIRDFKNYKYVIRNMDTIVKEMMTITKQEINAIFDMYLSRVCDTVTKIDYCSEITHCVINSFNQKGYPISEISICTKNDTACTIRTSVKWNRSKYNKWFGQYPTTIHDIVRAGSDKKGGIYEVASDNFNHVWTSFKAIEKNEKTNRAIARLEEELSSVQKTDPSDRFYDARYIANRSKKLNARITKEKAKLIDVKAYRDVGQSLIKAVA